MILSPDEALERFRRCREGLTETEFFNRPENSRLRDLWAAAHFGRGFETFFGPCKLRFEEERDEEFDFELYFSSRYFPFQVTEVLEPDRRRGLEYRLLEAGERSPNHLESWEEGTKHGYEWIRKGIENKRRKHYANVDQLRLLVYANFPAYDLQYLELRDACSGEFGTFASIWVISGNTLCTLQPDPQLGEISSQGWGVIDLS